MDNKAIYSLIDGKTMINFQSQWQSLNENFIKTENLYPLSKEYTSELVFTNLKVFNFVYHHIHNIFIENKKMYQLLSCLSPLSINTIKITYDKIIFDMVTINTWILDFLMECFHGIKNLPIEKINNKLWDFIDLCIHDIKTQQKIYGDIYNHFHS
jgi:hypothetical protein